MIEALIFDMDGLLIDSESLAARAMDTFLGRYGLERRSDIHHRLLGRRLPDAMAIVKEAYGLEQSLPFLIDEYGDLRLEALRGSVKPMRGALEIIAFGRSSGLKIALATSGMRKHATVSMSETGLTGLFDAEVTGDEVQHGKPAPDLFLEAARRIGAEPTRCVVFEDAPNGVAAGKAAGMIVIAVPNESSHAMEFPVAADVVLPDLLAAPGWLARFGIGTPPS